MKTKLCLLISCVLFQLSCYEINAQGASLPYYTGWDNATEKAGWTQYRMGHLSSFDWNDNNQLSHDYNVGGAPTQTVVDWYVSPPFNFANTSKISMNVRTSGFGQPTIDNCEVYFSSSQADPALGTYTLIGNISFMNPKYVWKDTTFAIPFTSGSGYIAFKYKTIGAAWSAYDIDSLRIKLDPLAVSLHEYTMFTASLAPNPFSDVSTFTFSSPLENAGLCIYSLSGKLVRKLEGLEGMQVHIKRQDLPAGLYFFEVAQRDKPLLKGKIMVSGE